jgi:hypothetical protein
MLRILNKTKQPSRRARIDILGDAPWGVHFCLFYRTREDWIETAKGQARTTGLANFFTNPNYVVKTTGFGFFVLG